MTDEPEPSNIIDMNTQARLIREAREARAKRREGNKHYDTSMYAGAPTATSAPAYPGGIDDMELG